ncbi:hypothetical protein SAMN04487904_102314 [Actinopolyspora lacussalsi subsp. righensis]|uniref:DUF8129 domain-containing protein n=1 Tax=Actinopolyspora righensis TaxID=995060 RepID=A0A1I6Y9Y2_9ACTN|nr:hypothetical protein [Actinopolyspora righensis]SFT46984.1 hypothetical protein SAMN04487904_102314 [Actinopolyspora righensis]
MTAQLPIPDYDEMPLSTLGHRIRSLTEDELNTLLEYERTHAARVPVIEQLTGRLNELRQGAEPTPGPEEEPSDVPGHSRSGSEVTPEPPRGKGRPTAHGTRSTTGKGIEHD